MSGSTHHSTWVDADTKQRFSGAAARQGLSESALLKRLIEQMLAADPAEAIAPLMPVDLRDARVTVRLVPEDRALLRERAAARVMPAATYVSMLVRAHLRRLAPLPDRELSALRSAVNELAVLGRNLNTIARFFQQDRREVVPGRGEVYAMLKICEGLRDHFRELIKANLVSWEAGHAERLIRVGSEIPLLDIRSFARQGPDLRLHLSSAFLEQIVRTVLRAPEVVVKVSGGASRTQGAIAHLRYIDRQGKREIETDEGQRTSGVGIEAARVAD